MPTCIMISPRDASWPIYGASGEVVEASMKLWLRTKREKTLVPVVTAFFLGSSTDFATQFPALRKSRTQYYRYLCSLCCRTRTYPPSFPLPRSSWAVISGKMLIALLIAQR